MPKLTYLLIQTAVGAQYPIAVSGNSGVLYGHAEMQPAGQPWEFCHVLRVSQEDYEKNNFAMARDIALVGHRSFGKWMVLSEVMPDLESTEGRLAQQLDAALAEIETLKGLLEAASKPTLPALELPSLPASELLPQAETEPPPTTATVVSVTVSPAGDIDPERTRLENLEGGYRAVRAEAKEKRPDLNLAKLTTKAALIDAMLTPPVEKAAAA